MSLIVYFENQKCYALIAPSRTTVMFCVLSPALRPPSTPYARPCNAAMQNQLSTRQQRVGAVQKRKAAYSGHKSKKDIERI